MIRRGPHPSRTLAGGPPTKQSGCPIHARSAWVGIVRRATAPPNSPLINLAALPGPRPARVPHLRARIWALRWGSRHESTPKPQTGRARLQPGQKDPGRRPGTALPKAGAKPQAQPKRLNCLPTPRSLPHNSPPRRASPATNLRPNPKPEGPAFTRAQKRRAQSALPLCRRPERSRRRSDSIAFLHPPPTS